ncbi:MAG TPA: hypothetical protein EYO98_03475, partial [Candidatus Poseidoniales archaeon]|nr:hypothetical protein [Candidatus Poseidoniales archaeon]
AYILGGFAGILACSGAVLYFDLDRAYLEYLAIAGIPLATLTGVYTAWLFGQARGRSWSEDRFLTAKMFVEMLVAGIASLILLVSSNHFSLVLAVACLAAVSMHAHRMVIEPQMETLH